MQEIGQHCMQCKGLPNFMVLGKNWLQVIGQWQLRYLHKIYQNIHPGPFLPPPFMVNPHTALASATNQAPASKAGIATSG